MKKIILAILVLFLGQSLFAKEIDITISKGIDQSVIVSLTPAPASYDADQDIVLKAVFDVELDESSVQKNNIKLKKITQNQESMIDGEVAYDVSENAVTFTPSTVLGYGYYEVEFKSLKAVKSQKDQLIKEIKYRFYVPEVVNGYKLPPEPDETLNNSTLLGVDVNENGVRDDVERYIIYRFQRFKNALIDRAIALQYAKASQVIIQNPNMAYENRTYEVMDDALNCKWYYFKKYLKDVKTYLEGAKYRQEHKIFDAEFKDKVFNTRQRLEAYLEYNDALSGKIYPSKPHIKEKCDFDIDRLLGGEE